MPIWLPVTLLLVVGLAVGIVIFSKEDASPPGKVSTNQLIGTSPPFQKSATYVGGAACVSCHQREHELWSGSHHDLAMQVANQDTVLGDFNNATFSHFGITSTFSKREGKYFVRTDGPDGALHDYEIAYTFGITPLQQYLILFFLSISL